MNVAILCEFTGTVRDAFLAVGHNAISCDLLPTESKGPHIQGDLRDYDWTCYDLLICHPPCTHLAVSGAHAFYKKQQEQKEAISLISFLWKLRSKVRFWALENPISIISSLFGKPTQIIQPWEYGHPEPKSTCLWLSNLPKLSPTNVVPKGTSRILKYGSGDGKKRSRFYRGIAQAMALQWPGTLA